MDVKSAAKRELERDYAALFDVDDDELTLATEKMRMRMPEPCGSIAYFYVFA